MRRRIGKVGYYLRVVKENLEIETDITKELETKKDQFYLSWKWEDGYVGLDHKYFSFNNNLFKDLLILQDMGVRGQLTAYGEELEFYRFNIDNDAVREYYGYVVFQKEPHNIVKVKDEIKNNE